MSDVICVTNRNLCTDDFLERVQKIAALSPKAIVLREKDLSESDYARLAKEVLAVCQEYNVPCILHTFVETAKKLQAKAIHVPLPILRTFSEETKQSFSVLGTSCHSVEDAVEAEQLGCTYLIAGHIYATDCKRGLPERGLDFLHQVCNAVSLPVYAIGGINPQRVPQVLQAGAKGGCVMSGLMTCQSDDLKNWIL